MLALEKVLEVKRLLDEGNLSRRAIAAQTGASRGTVNAIANGERGLHGRRQEDLEDDGLPRLSTVAERCPGCGGLVFMPCVLCEARLYTEMLTAPRRVA